MDCPASNDADSDDFIHTLQNHRYLHPHNLLVCHLNVNSIGKKFQNVKPLLCNKTVDMLFISETKLDQSYPSTMFEVKGYSLPIRADRNIHGGGIMLIIRDDMKPRRLHDIEELLPKPIESLIVEVMIKNEMWVFICIYSPDKSHKNICCDAIEIVMTEITKRNIKTHFLLGDLNIDTLNITESKCLKDVTEMYGSKNIIKDPTCFKSENGSQIDVIFTPNYRRVAKTFNLVNGVSDFHNMVGFSTKICVPRRKMGKIVYRSYKHFDEDAFCKDIANAPFHVSDIFDEIDDKYNFMDILVTNILNEHAPLKSKKPLENPNPYMNAELRKTLHYKAMLRNKYFRKGRNKHSWEEYRKIRNKSNKIRAKSIQNYFNKNCSSGKNTNEPRFWNTIKPFISSKDNVKTGNITLREQDVIISEPQQICNIFNEYFCNVAKDIGPEDVLTQDITISNIMSKFQDHMSIQLIKEHSPSTQDFIFNKVEENDVKNLLYKTNPKKAVGFDGIPPKILKIASKELAGPITYLINDSIITCRFPRRLKFAEVATLFKSKDVFNKENYRPLSILPAVSKIFERTLYNQMYAFFDKIFFAMLAAYRPKYGCPQVLLKLIEDWKKALDNKENIGSILMDLSKAFDCIPHSLLICKLKTYGISENACTLVKSYLEDRRQRVKINECRSDWDHLYKGVPQGSILGPLLFNIFIHDLFYHVGSSLYNFADDNTLSKTNSDVYVLTKELCEDGQKTLLWFENNYMKANPAKFQGFTIIKQSNQDSISLSLSGVDIPITETIKLLGLYIDSKLKFDEHVSKLCKKAAFHVNAMRRISKYLDTKSLLKLFHAFIRSNFQYANVVWHFTSNASTLKMEKLQRRALQVVYNNYVLSYNELLVKAKIPSLYVSRIKTIATETYKCINKINPKFLHDLFQVNETEYLLRDQHRVVKPKVSTTTHGLNSFSFEASKIWNDLPCNIKDSGNLTIFISEINDWSGPKCVCRDCVLCTINAM